MKTADGNEAGIYSPKRVQRAIKWPLALAGVCFLGLLLMVAPVLIILFMMPIGLANGVLTGLVLAMAGAGRRIGAVLMAGGIYLLACLGLPYALGSNFGRGMLQAEAWWSLAWLPGTTLAVLGCRRAPGIRRACGLTAIIVAILLGTLVPVYLIVTGALRIDL